MQLNKIIPFNDADRSVILEQLGFNNEEPLLIAVEATIARARLERPATPNWIILGARNAEAITIVREACEAHGGWIRDVSRSGLDGVRHIESGRFLAVHNTCERTGLNKDLPRFASSRARAATKSLRDDLQGDFCQLFEDFKPAPRGEHAIDDLALHLCVFILRETLDTGEVSILARAELVVGAICSDLGITACQYRFPLDLSGMVGVAQGADKTAPHNGDAVEAEISIRRKL